jgi:hypothetical protein
MSATPETGTLIFNTKPDKSGNGFSLNYYVSDVIGGFVTFNLNGTAGSGSQGFINMPATMYLVDAPISTGLAVSTVGVVQMNDQNTGSSINWASMVNTIASRPNPAILIQKGVKLTILQA